MIDSILKRVNKFIVQPHLKQLVLQILKDHDDLLRKMPAAQSMHHNYTCGLLEHVWSMSRVGEVLVEHYGMYYQDLNPPLDKGLVIAAIILHDIGKLRELSYHPVEVRYTKEGSLVGHVLMGATWCARRRRRSRATPRKTFCCSNTRSSPTTASVSSALPILPQTFEALLVSYIDDLDAKMNVAARHRLLSKTEDEFTDRVYALDNRRIYKGIPRETPDEEDGGF